jgi:carboxyl-terminal processing protease
LLLPAVRVTLLLLLVAVVHGCAASRPGGAAAGEAVTAELALLTFDSAGSRSADSHYSADYNGIDWPGVRAELRPRAAAARTLDELRIVIDGMLARLGESHYALIRREAAGSLEEGAGNAAAAVIGGDAGFDVRLVGNALLVSRVEREGAAAAAGIAPGFMLLAIDGRPLAARIAALARLPEGERHVARTRLLHSVNGALRGGPGDTLTLRLGDAAGRATEQRLVLRPARGQVVSYGNLPPMMALLEEDRIETARGCVGVIRLSLWAVPLLTAFDDAVDRARGCAGIVIDLRGNPGGVGGMVMGAAGHFVNDTVALGHLRTRTGELRYMVNPRRVRRDGAVVTPFAGPLAILLDEMSASASEIFAAGLQALGRARIFGSPSAGQALPALMVRLPTGDVLLHVVADFTGPHGARIEGRGVLPDVPVTLTRDDLLARRDLPLEAAVRWITNEGKDP